jgi:excinuclease ABC subunit B
MFQVKTLFKPAGDQPKAIKQLTKNLETGAKHHILLGVTGSGKTATMSWVIEKTQKPALIISPNKTLAAQLYQEFKEFFPQNPVHYFVSYYDYYQPEAYLPQTDTYIEKDAKINEIIDRLRHATVQDLILKKEVIVVASVSCIYNLGSPFNYQKASFHLKKGQLIKRRDFLKTLTTLQYQRNEIDWKPGNFRVRGEVIEIYLRSGKEILSVEFENSFIQKISLKEINSSKKTTLADFQIFPAQFWLTPENELEIALKNIELELQERLQYFKRQKKFLPMERLDQRTRFDLEMIRETGYCHGIENYSRHLEFRKPGEAPFTLIDYFRYVFEENFLVFIDESHLTCPQLKAMFEQDRQRKLTLIEYGFRLPSALDNRPLNYKEFEEKVPQVIYVSATPASFEKRRVLTQTKKEISKKYIVEQIIRPTGLLEPEIEIKPSKNQLYDLINQIIERKKKNQRVLVLTLTKRLAEAISEKLLEKNIKAQYLHSEIKTLERPEFLKKLRKGDFDVLVGINLLREGLDLPEVSLVAILDADKEGFLRSETTLIQIMGRAARHLEGKVILYADKITHSMKKAIQEINRRRKIQEAFNKKMKIKPQTIKKEILPWIFPDKKEVVFQELGFLRDIKLLEKEMKLAAANLDFEKAAAIRDLIKKLKKEKTLN